VLIYRRTSLLESSAQTLVNTVNCVGVMGKGIAKEFKEREPQMFAAYKKICDQNLLSPGKLWLWRGSDFWILNFPTKIHWRNPSKIEWIEAGLKKFVAGYQQLGIREISFPRLGCGNGGLDWNEVRPLMERYLAKLPIPIFVHDFTVDIGLPEHMEAIARKLPIEDSVETSFEAFLKALYRAIDLAGPDLIDIETRDPIAASLLSDDNLKLESEKASWIFDSEGLRGVWISLQKGLLTKDKAGWSVKDGGKPLLSLLSLLPNVRPVQIQRLNDTEPELAVEFRPNDRGSVVVPLNDKKQLDLKWH